MNKREIREKVEDGALQVSAILQIVGKPKEHVDKTLTTFVEKLKTAHDLGYQIYQAEIHEAQLQEDTESLYSAFADVEMICNDIKSLMYFCMHAMPASVEVIEPEEFTFPSHAITDIMNDFVARIHETDDVAKKIRQEHKFMSQSLGIMIQNAIMIFLNLGPRNSRSISEHIGVDQDQVDVFLKKLTADKKLVQSGENYALATKKQD